jgi:DNA (cytosine-5)-methyltransferase 1
MNVLDLFSGIGGFSLGLERAGMTTVQFVEIDPFCQKVLKKHWPEVPIWSDIKTFTAEKAAADVICGGFPCQGISIANAFPMGLEDERSGLWKEYFRVVCCVLPDVVIVENVSGFTIRGLLEVLGDFASIGYHAEWETIPSSVLGFPHQRKRIIVIAYSEGYRSKHSINATGPVFLKWNGNIEKISTKRSLTWDKERLYEEIRSAEFVRTANGIPYRMDRVKALGNSIVPQIAEIIGKAIMEVENT